jgi:hypothetical protein
MTAVRRLVPVPGLFELILAVLILWKIALWLNLPLPTTDGVQSLSHTFSLMRGQPLLSTLWHNWMPIYQLPYGFSLAAFPLMALLPFGLTHNYFAASLLFALAAGAAAWFLVRSNRAADRVTAALAALAVFVYPHLWVMRPESVTIPLLLVTLGLIRRAADPPRPPLLALIGLLIAYAGIAHPLGGLIGTIALTGAAFERRWPLRRLFGAYALIGLFAAALYLPVVLIDVGQWVENFLGFFTREEPRGLRELATAGADAARFVGWGLPLIVLYGRTLLVDVRRAPNLLIREGALLLAFSAPILLAGAGSYFTYLIVLLVWRLAALPAAGRPPRWLMAALLIVLPAFSHYLPTIQALENPRYSATVRAALAEVERYAGRTEPGLVWISVRLALPIADEPYARVIANYYQLGRYPEPIPVAPGDVLLTMWEAELETIRANYALDPSARIEAIIEPVPGPLTVESLLRARQPAVGLWRIVPGG